MKPQIEESLKFIRSTTDLVPKGAVVLGTGLRDAIGELDEAVTIPYSHIPHFPTPTVPSHPGELVIGRIGNYPLAVMRGRVHFYEGYQIQGRRYRYHIRSHQPHGSESLARLHA
ncbi:Purine nucleoside phosphorylase 1 [subsurface metagenome]